MTATFAVLASGSVAGRVGQQDDRLLGEAPGDGAARRWVQIGTGRAAIVGRAVARGQARDRGPAGVEQAKLALLPEDPGDGAVDDLLGDLTGGRGQPQRLAVAADAGQFDVYARRSGRAPPRSAGVAATACCSSRKETA